MTVTPSVELRFHPTDLDPSLLHEATRRLGSPSEAIEAALLMARLSVMTMAKAEVAKLAGEMSAAKLVGIADAAWQLYAPKFTRALGPVFADQYLRTMKAAGAGEIPMATVYALAEQHAARIGAHYHESSRDALVGGFNTFVNRRMTERVAADRVLDAYGLTARGMAGYTSRSLDKAATVTPVKLRQRVLDYIGTSVRRRSKVFATQEAHNIDQQAQQIAWMWLQDKGQLSPAAEKVWMTARDEKVCTQCGPMHNVRRPLTERFRLPNGSELYVPGAHPNCRCQVRVLDHPYKQEMSKADWNPKEHPRGGDPENPGRFSVKARTRARPVAERQREDLSALQRFLDTAQETEPKIVVPDDDRPKVVVRDEPKVVINDQPVVIDEEQPKVAIDEPVTADKVVVGDDRVVVGDLTGIDTRPVIRNAPAQRLSIHDQAAPKVPVESAVPVAPRTPEPNPIRRKPTIRLDQPGMPGPMYYIPSRYEVYEAEEAGRINLNTEMEFTQLQVQEGQTQEEVFYGAAKDAMYDEIRSDAEQMWEEDNAHLSKTLDDGTTVRAIIDEEDVVSIISIVVEGGEGTINDRPITLEWTVHMPGYPHDGEPIGERETIKMSQIGHLWSVEPEQYSQAVLRLTEGHDSELGRTSERDASTRYGPGVWVGTGYYTLEQAPDQDQHGWREGLPITLYDLIPEDVEIVEHQPRGVGWPTDRPE